MNLQIVDAKSQDVYQNWNIQKSAWLAGYVNEGAGITKEEILSFFDETSENNKKKIKEREVSVNNDQNTHLWEAKVNGEVVGFAAAKKGEKCILEALFVSPEFQEKGIGGILINKALEWIGLAEEVYVFVTSYNKNAINFYKHFGFTETGNIEDSGMDFSSGVRVFNLEMKRG